MGALLDVGSVIEERYKLERRLGEGAAGSVWLAEDIHLKRHVAIKLIHSHFDQDGETVARLQREAKVLQRLDHPNILKVFRIGTIDFETYFLAMEYVEGSDLREMLAQGRMPIGVAADVALQIAEAMCEAAEHGVIHRDLKPQNILVTKQDAPGALLVKVADFGLSRTVSDATLQLGTLTREGVALGTPLYMSPEQCQAMRADTRADIYSLGCVLFEMITGSPPYDGETPAVVLMKHVHDPVPDLLNVVERGEGVADMQRVIARAMAKDPRDRYQSFAEVVADLRPIAETRSLSKVTLRPTVRYKVRRKTSPLVPLVVATGCLALAVGAVLFISPDEVKASGAIKIASLIKPDSVPTSVFDLVVFVNKLGGRSAARKLAEASVNSEEFRRLPPGSRVQLLESYMRYFSTGTATTADADFFGDRLLTECIKLATSPTWPADDALAAKYLDVLLEMPWDGQAWTLFEHTMDAYKGRLIVVYTMPNTPAGMRIEELMAETILRTHSALTPGLARFVGELYNDASIKAQRYHEVKKVRTYALKSSKVEHKFICDVCLLSVATQVESGEFATARKDLDELQRRLETMPFGYPRSVPLLEETIKRLEAGERR
ncbi:MAG: serine/threonine-protein kinase [Candidatus Obscuribacterales bacterium]